MDKFKNKIIQGDCLEVMKGIPDNSVDMILTSPPYDNLRSYNNSLEWNFDIFKNIALNLSRLLKSGSCLIWIVADQTNNFCESLSSFKQAIFFVDQCKLNLLDTMIWVKPNYAPGYPTLRRYDNVFEFMMVFSKGKPAVYNLICDKEKKESSKKRNKYKTSFIKTDGSRNYKDTTNNNKLFSRRTNVWTIPNGQIRGLKHPAVFPENLAKDHILTWSKENDIVLDPFIGSGTTAIACINTNRNYIGIEKEQKYVDSCNNRIKEINNE